MANGTPPLDFKYVLAAILTVRNKMMHEQPGAEHWITDTRWSRKDVYSEVAQIWSNLTGYAKREFPFHSDFIAAEWMRYRKHGEDIKLEKFRQLVKENLLSPDNFLVK
jgi:hypothetical protein